MQRLHETTINKLDEMFGAYKDLKTIPFKTQNLISALDFTIDGFLDDEYGNHDMVKVSFSFGNYRKKTVLFLSMRDTDAEAKNRQIMNSLGIPFRKDEIKTINCYVQIYASLMVTDKVVEMISSNDEVAEKNRSALNHFGNFLKPRPWG